LGAVVVAGTAASWASGEILRLSKVSEKETPNTERLEWKHDNKREVLFVEKQVIVSEPDVKSVMLSVYPEHALSFEVTPEGAKRLADATTDGPGRMRIAILIHGEVTARWCPHQW